MNRRVMEGSGIVVVLTTEKEEAEAGIKWEEEKSLDGCDEDRGVTYKYAQEIITIMWETKTKQGDQIQITRY